MLAIKLISIIPIAWYHLSCKTSWYDPIIKKQKNSRFKSISIQLNCFLESNPLPYLWHYLLYCSVCTENGQLIWKVVWEEGGCWRDLNRRNLGAPAHHALVLFESMQKGQVMSHLLLNGHTAAAAPVNHCDPYRLAKQLNPKDTIYCPLLYV